MFIQRCYTESEKHGIKPAASMGKKSSCCQNRGQDETLFRFYLSVAVTLDDTMKLEHTHTFLHFQYYFRENRGLEDYLILQTVVVEWVLYLVLYRRANSRGKIWGGMLYFTASMILHIGICLHANSLYPSSLPDEVRKAGLAYRSFANITVSASVVYCVVYLWYICKLRKANVCTKESSSVGQHGGSPA